MRVRLRGRRPQSQKSQLGRDDRRTTAGGRPQVHLMRSTSYADTGDWASQKMLERPLGRVQEAACRLTASSLHLRSRHALLASRLPPAVDADAAAPALLASRLPPAVDADAAASALLALRLQPAVDADAAAPALFALWLLPAVHADVCVTTIFASRFTSVLGADRLCLVHLDLSALRSPSVV